MNSRLKNRIIAIFMVLLFFALGLEHGYHYTSSIDCVELLVDSNDNNSCLSLNKILLNEDLNNCILKHELKSLQVFAFLVSRDVIITHNYLSAIWQPPKL